MRQTESMNGDNRLDDQEIRTLTKIMKSAAPRKQTDPSMISALI